MESTLTLVLAGGRGERLLPLTARRAKPVMPFAGRRLIDYTLENCRASGLRDVVVLTQHRAEDVHDHLDAAWSNLMPDLHTLSSDEVGREFRGTADAVRAALARFPEGRRVLVLAADHVYKMDYRDLTTDHRAQRAEATIAVVPVPLAQATKLGCAKLDESGLVQHFVEKPRHPPAMPGHPRHALGSMGIYLFRRHALEEVLYEFPEADDFAQHVIPGLLLCGHRVATHYFADDTGPRYWRDIGDPEGYHAAHMDLLRGTFEDGESWIGPLSLVAGAELERCVLGRNVQIGPGATVRNTVLLDGATVGPGARVVNAIIDKNVRIAAHAHVGSDAGITVITEPVAVATRHTAAS